MEKVKLNGKDVEINEVDVIASNEYWNSYTLANGMILRTKSVLVSIYEAAGEKDQDGKQVYITKTNNIIKIVNKEF